MTARSPVIVAIDAGTTGVRALVVDESARVVDVAYRELVQHFPRPGWVEHDPNEIWDAVRSTLDEVAGRLAEHRRVALGLGITNQRETVVAWDRVSGRPLHPAIVWQDRRTAERCQELTESGFLPMVRERTGLVLDPYFSATKMEWLLGPGGGVPPGPGLALGTVDSWILWNLTGGARGGVFATDTTNAARTLLFDIVARRWSDELCEIFGVPEDALPEVHPSCGRFGRVSEGALGLGSPFRDVPVSGVAGDQHAALFGQACFRPGMTKVTFGTGSFVLMNAGPVCPPPVDGLVTTVAWDLGAAGELPTGPDRAAPAGSPVTYALEGSVFASGAGVQWLRDGLGIIDAAAEIEPLARSVTGSDGVVVVPAFTGLGSPHWDPEARGTVVGLSRGSGRAHLARAMVEAMSFQVADVLVAMAATPTAPSQLRVDGGASVMDLLLQLLADQSRLPVVRPSSVETTAIGAATLAGLAEGLWGSLDDLGALWTEDAAFAPIAGAAETELGHHAWERALDRSRHWSGAS